MTLRRALQAAPSLLVDLLVPPRFQGKPRSEVLRARILIDSCLVAIVLLSPFLYIHAVVRGPAHLLFLSVLAAMIVALATLLLFRICGSILVSGLFLTTMETVVLGAFIVHDGGFRSSAIMWIPILPLFTVFFAGWRYGVANAGALVAFLLWLFVAHTYHFLPPVNRTDEPVYLVFLLSAIAVLVQLIVIALLYLVWQRVVQDELSEANRAKTQFLSNMSHELRTPLNAIIGYAEVLGRDYAGPLVPKQQEYVGNIESAGKHLLHLVNDILDLSKIEARKLELELHPIGLKTLLLSCARMFQQEMHNRNLTFRQVYGPSMDGARIRADERRIRQVVFNLLSNATKFTPEQGEIVLEGDVQGSVAVVRVRDSGIGIHPDHIEKIFHTFYQAHDRQEWIRPGTGLGLALTRELVRWHGGRIWAESEGEGRGSLFVVEFPLAPSPDPTT